jgi:hypothetical protein
MAMSNEDEIFTHLLKGDDSARNFAVFSNQRGGDWIVADEKSGQKCGICSKTGR